MFKVHFCHQVQSAWLRSIVSTIPGFLAPPVTPLTCLVRLKTDPPLSDSLVKELTLEPLSSNYFTLLTSTLRTPSWSGVQPFASFLLEIDSIFVNLHKSLSSWILPSLWASVVAAAGGKWLSLRDFMTMRVSNATVLVLGEIQEQGRVASQ